MDGHLLHTTTFRVTMNSDLSEELVPAYYSTDSKNQAHRVLQSKLGKELNFLACFFCFQQKINARFQSNTMLYSIKR